MTTGHDPLAAWCAEAFGAPPVARLFEKGHLSRVAGYRLQDGVEVVVKMRPAAERIVACLDLQAVIWRRGFPCPQPLAGPSLIDGQLLTAEAYVTPGETLAGVDAAQKFAEAFARLMAITDGLQPRLALHPPLPWLGGWLNHDALWPPADDLTDDLNSIGTPWLDELAHGAASLLRATPLPGVVGHADWNAINVEWRDGQLHVVHDWDSLAYLPEAALAGGAAVLYCSGTTAAATMEQSEAFLAAYEASRGRTLSDEERRVFWAAGLWNLAFDAKKEVVRGPGDSLEIMRREGKARLRLAGV